jgi:hypothetical protein
MRDIKFPIDIPYHDFRDHVIASMSLDPATAALGWKTSDQGKCAAARELNNHFDMENAFSTVLNIQDNPRRRREIVLEIVHLVSLSSTEKLNNLINHSHRTQHLSKSKRRPTSHPSTFTSTLTLSVIPIATTSLAILTRCMA